ncbi:hypothetical protein BaRGS_00012909 [Batillaria attramentaria]|uniref:Uncharacterized protein n=1 Tax=Batillaria attramentaria TaxID=370345 RepID=A0ABD0L940_9CAEN|nr:hypothetical protein BaRGS_030796 [Batillaria attramentaria]
MTSERATPPSQTIVWDKSRLHAEKAARNGTALVPTSAGPVQRSGSLPAPAAYQRVPGQRSPESELTTSFDPMKDMHMWTMWRAAVNGRIVDEARKRQHRGAPPGQDFNPYGKALVKTPLDRFIRMGNSSQNIAHVMMDPHQAGNGHLHTNQFVFYGVPRVVLNKPKRHTVTRQIKKLP